MKHTIGTAFGLVSAMLVRLLGGWDEALASLLIFMGLDFGLGLLLAWMGKSPKTESGALSSKIGWQGACRKGITLVYVLVGARLDLLLGLEYIRNAVIFGFLAIETISITENAGLLGVPLPKAITKAIEMLREKEAV